MSISLSTKNRRLSNIFWCMSTLPLAFVATTSITLRRSGVSPGHGASAMVMMEPSIYDSILKRSWLGMCMSSPFTSSFMPSLRKLSGISPKSFIDTLFIVRSEPVIAAMPIKLPTSIMSGRMVWLQPLSSLTPFIVSRLEPMPCISAPIDFSILHSCCI